MHGNHAVTAVLVNLETQAKVPTITVHAQTKTIKHWACSVTVGTLLVFPDSLKPQYSMYYTQLMLEGLCSGLLHTLESQSCNLGSEVNSDANGSAKMF